MNVRAAQLSNSLCPKVVNPDSESISSACDRKLPLSDNDVRKRENINGTM